MAVDDRIKRMWQMMEVPADPAVLVRTATCGPPAVSVFGILKRLVFRDGSSP